MGLAFASTARVSLPWAGHRGPERRRPSRHLRSRTWATAACCCTAATSSRTATTASKLALICGQYTGWGGVLLDYDNDGDLDLFVANGNAHHEYTEEDILAANDGAANFTDVARDSGPYFGQKYVGRGATCGDYDNDGDLDILVVNLNDTARLLRNDGGTGTTGSRSMSSCPEARTTPLEPGSR